MLTPFDIRFAKELERDIRQEISEFRERIASCSSYDDVKFQIGYFNALDNVLISMAEIEAALVSGET